MFGIYIIPNRFRPGGYEVIGYYRIQSTRRVVRGICRVLHIVL